MMTVASAKSGAAMQQVLDNLRDLPPSSGAKDIDLIFLRGIMESPIVRSLAKAHDRLEDVKLEAVRDNNLELVTEILTDMGALVARDDSAAELSRILKEPHFQSLLEAHDMVACKSYEVPSVASVPSDVSNHVPPLPAAPADTIRVISIQKKTGEPLGVTFRVEGGDLVITRILHGGMIDRQGMLHVGDVIREVSGHAVGAGPEELQQVLRDTSGSITLKILPSYRDTHTPAQVCVCVCVEFDRHELQIYEEVAHMPPFQRRTLVLIGAQGVGRRSLKNRLILLNPLRYGTTVPYTSRPPRGEENDGQAYGFVSRAEMEQDIRAGRYLEHGEYDGNMYGTKIHSIHQVVNTGRTCILDVNPQALKVLKTAEFMPFVVFIAAPPLDTLRAMHKAVVDAGITSKQLTEADLKKTVDESARIRRAYSHYFDLTVVNDNLDRAFDTLQGAAERLGTEPQWVPVSWVF
ncbi:MAGUK p55 subfamily member 6a [Clupea harengus]|uniref:MAGUK p55 subfamily member 6a n=1 Tax=Clupea harengus TaxID=7950 RepID=A0A8M1KR00_CLUHA|nr:MAGUK p55 subfamily member 6a [Clupea harengus]